MARGLRKIIALSVCIVFAATETGLGISPASIEVRPSLETPSFLQIDIPDELATVEDVYEAPAKLDPRLVLHVQNAHGNYEAQVTIKKILKHLNENYGFELIFVEGVEEEMDTSQINFFEDPKKNLEVVEYLAKKGQATGADLFLMEAEENVKAVGIENASLYRGNYAAFREVYSREKLMDEFLENFDSRIDLLSSRFLNSDMRKLISEWKKFQLGHRDFLPYVNLLKKEAKKILGLDLDSLFAQVEWPQMTRLLAIQSMELELDKEKALNEKELLLGFLEENKISKNLIEGIRKLEDKKINMNRLNKNENAIEHMPRHLLENLVEEAGPKGFAFHEYPAFSLYAGYVILSSELESQPLFTEIERLFKKILDELAVNEEEKDLLELFRDGELLRKLLFLELSSKDWARAYYRKDWINPESLLTRLEGVGERFYQDELKMIMDQRNLNEDIFESVNKAFYSAFTFYEYARKREVAFYSKIKDTMAKNKQNKAILLTGGFHTEGLMELFKEDEVNYGVLSPRISSVEGRETYLSVMMGNQKSMFDVSNIEIISLLQSLNNQQNLGANKVDILLKLLEGYLNVAKFKDASEASSNIVRFNSINKNINFRIIVDDDENEAKLEIDLNLGKGFLSFLSQNDKTISVNLIRSIDGYLVPANLAKVGNAQKLGVKVGDKSVGDKSLGGEVIPRQDFLNQTEAFAEAVIPTNPETISSFSDTSIRVMLTRLATLYPNLSLRDLGLEDMTSRGVSSRGVVTVLAGNIAESGPLEQISDTLEALAEFAKKQTTPISEIQINYSYLANDLPAIVTYIAPVSETGEMNKEKIRDLLAMLEANPATVLNIIVPVTDNMTSVQNKLDTLIASVEGFSKARNRLLVTAIRETGAFGGDVGRAVQNAASVVRSEMRLAGIAQLPSMSELVLEYSVTIMSNSYAYVKDYLRGQRITTDFSSTGTEEFMGHFALGKLLTSLKNIRVKVTEVTASALDKVVREIDSWKVTDKFPAFLDSVMTGFLEALRKQTRIDTSA